MEVINVRIIRWATGIYLLRCLLVTVVSLALAQLTYSQADSALVTPIVQTDHLRAYTYENLDYGMTIGIEQTEKGRIWACWVGGGDNDDAFFVLNTSDDKGETWSNPRLVIDPHHPGLAEKRRTIVGNLWLDPNGKLWLFFDQAMTHFDGRAGLWYITCENPDGDTPEWSHPTRLWHGCALNKPIVLSDSTWMLNVSLWDRSKITELYKEAFHDLDSLRMAHVFISTDQGKTWSRRGGVAFPNPAFDEHHVVERKDGTLWMTARTGGLGIWQSVSRDKGVTWSAPEKYLEHISSRHHLMRLKSGRMLMIKHGDLHEKTRFRSKLTAYLSEDEGRTWRGGLMIDERRGVSYPDGFQAPNGTIFISYDRNRESDGEILMARFTEQDVLDGEFNSKQARSRLVISKPRGLDKLPAPSELVFRENESQP